MQKEWTPLIGGLLLLLAGLLFTRYASLSRAATSNASPDEKVNLALRRTAHFLLTDWGDTKSQIPAIEQKGNGVWLIHLQHNFNYDKLPALFQESFALHGIKEAYDVAVLDCSRDLLQLGFNSLDIANDKDAPCVGRDMKEDCYNIKVSFINGSATPPPGNSRLWGWFFVLIGVLLTAKSWLSARRKEASPVVAPEQESQGLAFGNSVLYFDNLILVVGQQNYKLTFREAKLLQLFAAHLNQLLERDFILKMVWEDEGIIVGRSVDVFVSRLRKILKSDPSLRITAVHGVGYRLERV